jgi:hypothetical protein
MICTCGILIISCGENKNKNKKTKINIIIKKSPPFDSRPAMILHNGGLARARSGHRNGVMNECSRDGGGSLERGLWQ